MLCALPDKRCMLRCGSVTKIFCLWKDVQTFYHQTFNHPTLNHDRARDETPNHVRVRVIDSSPLAISSCYNVNVTRCLVIKCP